MSGWNSHGYLDQETSLLHYTTEEVIGPNRSHGVELKMSDDGACLTATTAAKDVVYAEDDRRTEFCTRNNMLNSVVYINQEFELLSIECLKHDGTKCTSDIVFFINRIHDLLTLYRKTATIKDDLETRNHKLVCETDHLQSTSLRMKRLQEQTVRELDQEREKCRQISLKYNQVCIKLKSEKEEVKKLTAVLQSRDLQHKHEQKKKEREVHKLKERLHQLLADKVPDRKVGMDLMNVVGRRSEEGRRGTWKTGPEKQEEEMYQILISNYEERHRELMQENGELRDCLLTHQRELSALFKSMGDLLVTSDLDVTNHLDLSVPSEYSEHSIPSQFSLADLDEGYFQMPYEIVRHEIERKFKETCEMISNRMKKSLARNDGKDNPSNTLSKESESEKGSMEKRHTSDTPEVERLKKQISSYKAIIQQQEDLLKQALSSHTHSMEQSFLYESQLLKEKENLSEQKKIFMEEKTNLEKERQAVTEAVARLSKEKQMLQEERAKFIKQQLLSMSSFKDGQLKKFKRDGHNSRLLPATPVFSPAKSSCRVLASNPNSCSELYQAWSLSPLSSVLASGSVLSALSDRQRSINRSEDLNSPQQQPLSSATNSTSIAASSTSNSFLSSFTCSPMTDALTCTEGITVSHLSSAYQRSDSQDI